MKTDPARILVVTLSFNKKAPDRVAKSGDTEEIGTAWKLEYPKDLQPIKPSLSPTLQSHLRRE